MTSSDEEPEDSDYRPEFKQYGEGLDEWPESDSEQDLEDDADDVMKVICTYGHDH